ncbi:MAG: hypothetical protein JXA66_04345 [Oligoflexia bacterium]|nr:hypothetical protein [Oligoflexia bacterium]
MKEVLRLLELKNEYLEKYLTITKAFVMGLEDGNYEDLELLKENRENIIGIIDHIDEKIAVLAEKIEEADPSLTQSAKSAFFLKEKLVEELLKTDSKLFELINLRKEEILSDINDLRDVKEALKSYESTAFAATGTGNIINMEK